MKPLIVLSLMLVAGSAVAHDAYPWIRDPMYVDAGGTPCCHEMDCHPIHMGDLRREGDWWVHVPTGTRIRADERGTYLSQDPNTYACVRAGQLRCVMEGVAF